MDVQGSTVAKPYVEKARAEYVTLVDNENRLADLIGFKVVPNTYLIDEMGRFIGKASSREEVEEWVKETSASESRPPVSDAKRTPDDGMIRSLETIVRWSPGDANLWTQLADTYRVNGRFQQAEAAYQRSLSLNATSPTAHFRYGGFLLTLGKNEEALSHLQQALRLDPANYVIRKQIWAIEHPERFYNDAIDWDWQREQMKREAE